MQPSQTIPETAKVTVADRAARLHDPARTPTLIVSSSARLVIRSIACLSSDVDGWSAMGAKSTVRQKIML